MSLKAEYTKNWKTLFKIAGISSMIVVAFGFFEIMLTFLPDGKSGESTAIQWIDLFLRNPFMGLRNLGLVNIFLTIFTLPVYLGFYGAQMVPKRKIH